MFWDYGVAHHFKGPYNSTGKTVTVQRDVSTYIAHLSDDLSVFPWSVLLMNKVVIQDAEH